jgi:hypothetical protein
MYYCGPGESFLAGAADAGATAGVVFLRGPGSALCDAGVKDAALGAAGSVVIALSGFSRWSWLGPSPKLIRARESGTVFDCQPWSA